jgi:hypothetical protein
VTGTGEWFLFSESDLNEYSVLAALLIDSKDFCGDGSHFAPLSTSDFAGECHPSSKIQAHGKAPEEEREFGTFAPVADEVEFIRKAAPPTDLLRSSGPRCTSRAF